MALLRLFSPGMGGPVHLPCLRAYHAYYASTPPPPFYRGESQCLPTASILPVRLPNPQRSICALITLTASTRLSPFILIPLGEQI